MEERKLLEAKTLLKAIKKNPMNQRACARAQRLLEIASGAEPLQSYQNYLGKTQPSLDDRVFFVETSRFCLEKVLLGVFSVSLRCQSAEFLGLLKHCASIDALTHVIASNDLSPGFLLLRRAAAQSLLQIKNTRVREVLQSFLRDEDSAIRRAALISFIHRPDPNDYEVYQRAIRLGSPKERDAVAYSLGSVPREFSEILLKPLLFDPAEFVRLSAARALFSLRKTEEVAALLRQSFIKKPTQQCARLLGCLRDIKSIDVLIEQTENLENEGLAVSAILALGEIGDETVMNPLLQAASQEKGHVAIAAIEALTQLGQPMVVPFLLPLLTKGDRLLSVISALGRLGGPNVLSILLDLLVFATQEPENWRLRKAIVSALGFLGNSASVPILLSLLQENDGRLHPVTAEALGKTGDPAAVSALLSALDSKDANSRICASKALVWIGDVSLLEKLIERVERAQISTKIAAAYVLGSLAYQQLPAFE